jgi:hypothetical protein
VLATVVKWVDANAPQPLCPLKPTPKKGKGKDKDKGSSAHARGSARTLAGGAAW